MHGRLDDHRWQGLVIRYPHPQHPDDLIDVFFLRWSPDELSSVIHTGNQSMVDLDATPLLQVSINISEFAAALFALIKWGPLLETP